jgi:2-polyprenyl-6-methoxyphenol hydroxylase-like FAD-dependent oxidoreductase
MCRSLAESGMRKISVVGAGPAGLIFTYALLKYGYNVTLYSDRTPEDWLKHSTPTGTAALYKPVVDIERELGMDFWSHDMHVMQGVLLDFKATLDSSERLVLCGSFGGDGGAIDQRLRVHRWLTDLESLGGHLVIEAVTPERLDQIASESELTVLAAGKADLARIIPRDPERSVYDRPQRNLAMVIVAGMQVDRWDDRADFNPVKFNFFGDTGEYFWVPYTHKTAGKTWCVLWEAKPGGRMDIFKSATSAAQMVDLSRRWIHEHAPWEWGVVQGMKAIEDDPYSWLKGAFPPTARAAFGRLPCGRAVVPVGDTALTFDPIAGQGGNHASRHARYLAGRVVERGDRPFDEGWMREIADDWWYAYAKWAYTFNNILLEPLTEAGRIILDAAAKDRNFADRYFTGNFPKPRQFFPYLSDPDAARRLVERHSRHVV